MPGNARRHRPSPKGSGRSTSVEPADGHAATRHGCPFYSLGVSGARQRLTKVANTADWQPPAGSWASSASSRKTMLGNRGRDTAPEKSVRSAVHREGLRFRVAARPIPELDRTADMLFRPDRVAVFVDGCYWHGCPEHGRIPTTNTEYWSLKIQRNVARDRDTDRRLIERGWQVLRFWEHEDSDSVAATITTVVRSLRHQREVASPCSGLPSRDECHTPGSCWS